MLQHSVSFLANFQRSERRSKAKLTFDVASFSFLEKPVEQSKFLTFLSSLAFLADHAFPSVFLSYRHRPSVCSHGAQIDSVSRFDRGRVPWIDARPSLREQLLHLFSCSLYICLTLSRFSPTIRPSSELLKSRTRRGSARSLTLQRPLFSPLEMFTFVPLSTPIFTCSRFITAVHPPHFDAMTLVRRLELFAP